jgi:hypothetical protein
LSCQALPPELCLVCILPDLGVNLGLVTEVIGEGRMDSPEVEIELSGKLVRGKASERVICGEV